MSLNPRDIDPRVIIEIDGTAADAADEACAWIGNSGCAYILVRTPDGGGILYADPETAAAEMVDGTGSGGVHRWEHSIPPEIEAMIVADREDLDRWIEQFGTKTLWDRAPAATGGS